MDKRLLALVPEALRYVVLAVVWQWVGLLSNVGLSWVVAVLACPLLGIAAPASGPLVAWVLAASLAGRIVASLLSQRASFAASQDVKRVLRGRIFAKLLRLGPSYVDNVSTAEVVQLSVEGCEQLETYFGQYLPQLFYSVVAPVTLFAIVAPLSLPAAVVLLVFVPLIPLVIVAVQKVAKRILSRYWDQYAQLGDSFLENLQGLTTLKIYQADEARHRAMNEEAEHFRVVTMKVLSMQLNSIIVMDVVALGGAAAGIATALSQVAAGAATPFAGLLIVLLSAEFFIPMRQLGSYFHVAMNGMAASKKIFSLLDLDEPARHELLAQPNDTFQLRDVSFSYDGSREVLSHVSLEISSDGMTAIVGESGSGKSTIAALLAGVQPGYSGSVLLGGKQVRDLDPSSLAHHLTSVSLSSRLFSGTVRDNLCLARPDATDEQMWDALHTARLDAFLRDEDGLDTQLEQDGANLSGGQRQRLVLARAILANSDAYVFDEATSNIDATSEDHIMDAVRELSRDHSVLVISHRLANVVDARRIYVMDHGRVVGAGTHDELLRSCAPYARLWNAQLALERYERGDADEAQ